MLSVGADPVVVERQLRSGGLMCPQCGQRLAPWGHAAVRFVRQAAAVVERVRPRRAICSSPGGCGRSHVLLPRFCLGRRVDAVAVIWAALLARAAGWGWRRICAAAGRPASTVRGWLSRFAAHAESIRVGFARLERLGTPARTWIGWPRRQARSRMRSPRSGRRARRCAARPVRRVRGVGGGASGGVLGWLAARGTAAGDRGVVDQHEPASVTGRLDAPGSTALLLSITESVEVSK